MNPLLKRLAALRRRLWLVTTVRGGCWTLAVLVGALALACLLDILLFKGFGLEAPGLLRGLLLVGTLAGTCVVGYRWLLRPLSERMNDLSLALRVEAEYPTLNDALASTVEFLQNSGVPDRSVSPTLKREAVQRAMRLMEGCDFNKAVNTRGLFAGGLALLGAVVLTLPLVFIYQAEAGTALARVVDPFGDQTWVEVHPPTVLDIEYKKKVSPGQNFVVTGTVTGHIPGHALFEFDGYRKTSQKVDIVKGRIHLPLDLTKQQTDFRFRVRAGTAVSPKTGWHQVSLRQPPHLADLNGKPSPQIELFYPAYSELPSPDVKAPGAGEIKALQGTVVKLRGATDRPIAKALIEYKPSTPLVPESALLGHVGTARTLPLLGVLAGNASVTQPVVGKIVGDGREFIFEFVPTIQGGYRLAIEDGEGLAKYYDFDLSITPDPVPVVTLERPAASQNVLPNAEITIQIHAEDEIFAVQSVYFEVRRKDKNGQYLREPPLRVGLYDHQAAEAVAPRVLAAMAARPVPVVVPPLRLRPKQVRVGHVWSLKGFAKEGDILVLKAFAEDFNDVSAFKQAGFSQEVELRVVGKSALAAAIDDAMGQVEQDLSKIRDLQAKAIKKTEGAEAEWRKTGKIRPEDAVDIAEAEMLQKQIQNKVGAKDGEGLRGEITRLQQALKDNKLTKSPAGDRLKAIKGELDRLAKDPLAKIEGKLFEARQDLENKANAKPPQPKDKNDLTQARDMQQAVKKSLDELLGYLESWSGIHDIRAELRAILQEQQELQKETEKTEEEVRRQGKMTAEQEVNVRKMAELQNRLGDRTQKLIEKMEQSAAEQSGKDPSIAQALKKTAAIGRDAQLPREMKDTGLQLYDPAEAEKEKVKGKKAEKRQPQFIRAIDQQSESIKTLELMVEALEEERGNHLEKLAKQQKQEQQNLADLQNKLDNLKKEFDQANKIADPQEKKAALDKLAEKENQLKEELEKKARELARLQAPKAAKALEDAAKDVGKAADKINKGENPEDAQKDAAKKIEDAKNKLKEAQQKTEEELARELQAKLIDHLKGLKERQDAALQESIRIHKAMLQNSYWSRALLTSLGDHRETQQALSKETVSLKDKVKQALVFTMVLDKAIKSMDAAADQMKERREKSVQRQGPDPLDKEVLADENQMELKTEKHQRDASTRLERLMDALKQDLDAAKKRDEDNEKAGGDGGGGGGGGGGKAKAQDGIPPVAQLKVLREEQQELNQRTLEFAKRNPNVENLPQDQRTELESLRQDQERIFELFQKMAAAVNGEGGNP